MAAIGFVAPALAGSGVSAALITADAVVTYQPGNASANFQTPAAATGPIEGDTTGNSGFSGGGLNPFNPPYASNQIVVVGAGGALTLHLSGPVSTAGRTLGVFVNNGYQDVAPNGGGQAGNPATTFSPFPQAVVRVSRDGVAFVPLNASQPLTFDEPTNYYLDTEINGSGGFDFQPLGTQAANQGKPFLLPSSAFNGESYDQMRATLAGSAGGTWLDLSGTGLSQVNYVEFDVPAGAPYHMVVDSVSGVPLPEPASAAGLVLVVGLLLRRK